MKKTVLLTVLSLLLVSFLQKSVGAEKTQYAGIVVTWKGNVYIYREGESKRIRVEDTTAVREGDIITTDDESAVKILLADDTIVAMGEGGSLCVDSLSLDDGKRRLSLRIVAGTVRTIAGRHFTDASYLELKSQAALVRVLGTDFVVNSMEDATEVVSLDGTVDVQGTEGTGNTVRIESGYMTQVGPEGLPTPPQKVPDYYVEELIARTDVPVNMAATMTEEGCKDCHRPVYVDASRYKHPDILLNCTRCHIKDAEKRKLIRFKDGWGDNVFFLELEDDPSYSIAIRGKDSFGREASSETLRVVPSQDAVELSDDGKAPQVSTPEVVEVREGVFYSVTVRWKTDKPARSYIEYGRSRRLGNLSRSSTHYATEHRAVIEKLRRGKKYYIRAVAEDPYGRKAQSDTVKIKVKKAYTTKKDATGQPSIEGLKLLRVKDRWALRWKSNGIREGTISIGITSTGSRKDLSNPHYPGLKSINEAGFYVCGECHRGSIHLKASHPMVDVTPTVSGGLPLGSDGRMLCVTCHMSHGSQHPYVLRKEETELCRSCHE